MIALGHRFNIGARVLLTAPAYNDSAIVLAQYHDQFITGRVYVRQLPEPEEWHNGTYHDDLTRAVERWVERSSLDPERTRHMVALAHACAAHIEEGAHA